MMKIPFFGATREFSAHSEEYMARIAEVLSTGQVLQGPDIVMLERRMAALVGRRHGVAVNSCTDALYFALLAAGVQPGDEVLVTDFSFIASASCIVRLQAVPIFVDIRNTYDMDLERVAAAITPKTRAMILVQLFGQMSDPVHVEQFTREHDLILIEDAAQALGASFRGRYAGSIGLASCFSFDPTKPISAPGSGGMILVDDDVLANHLRRLRYHGRDCFGQYLDLGYNSQISTLGAAVLAAKLDHNDAWLARRRTIASYYSDRLSTLDLVFDSERPGGTHIYHKYVLGVPRRDALRAHLENHGIPTMVYYPCPLHRLPCFAGYGYEDRHYPMALSLSQAVVALPIHPFLTDTEVDAIVTAIKRFYC
jgi:dTDP-4-amino-4,6-dideoxygalactose transaminase